MIESIVLWFLRVLRFKCATCGEVTIERDRHGTLRCFECRLRLDLDHGDERKTR